MEEAFKEELKHNHKSAWFGYIRCFSKNCHFIFEHIPKGQRGVRCKICGTKVPKEVPRIFISGSWYYHTGHYCLKCAIQKIRDDVEEKEALASKLQDNLADLSTLLEILSRTAGKEKYKELIALGYLCAKLEPKRGSP